MFQSVVEGEAQPIGPWSDISDLKKQLKRISNQRAMAVAARFSGERQDATLKKLSRTLELAEVDLLRCQGLVQRGEQRVKAGELKSQIASTAHASAALRIDAVIRDLEKMKAHLKDQIRDRRREVREEEEEHPNHGIAGEQETQRLIGQASLSNNKVSRARRKLEESKTLDREGSFVAEPQPQPAVAASPAPNAAPMQTASTSTISGAGSSFLSSFMDGTSPSQQSTFHTAGVRKEDWLSLDFLSIGHSTTAQPKMITPLADISWDGGSSSDEDDEEEDVEVKVDQRVIDARQLGVKPPPGRPPPRVPVVIQPVVESPDPPDEPPGPAPPSVTETDSCAAFRIPAEEEIERQIAELRNAAKVLEEQDDVLAAELLLQRALELDPTHIPTLQAFAVFLHTKRGELGRAEAFFNRALQLCLPDVYGVLAISPKHATSMQIDIQATSPAAALVHHPLPPCGEGLKLCQVLQLLLTFANFMVKARGDVESAHILFQKALLLAPTDGFVLANTAHFLAQSASEAGLLKEGDEQIDRLFRDAIRCSPGKPNFILWYAKFLKRKGKLGPAELMYKSAVTNAKGNAAWEPTALCNYATFLFKQRKNVTEAQGIFEEALSRFPAHKGLRKNYASCMKHSAVEVAENASPSASRQQSRRAKRVQHSLVHDLAHHFNADAGDGPSLEQQAAFILQRLTKEASAESGSPLGSEDKEVEEEDGIGNTR